MPRAYVALGSNLGDRQEHLNHALSGLARAGVIVDGSPVYETAPVGGPDGQDAYLNAVIAIDTELEPMALLEALLAIEAERGRVRSERWGPRTLDCDLLWYDNDVIDEPGLTVPHPSIRERAFVLVPLGDLEPGLGDVAGPYLASLDGLDTSGLRRCSGPVDAHALRWMDGLEAATDLPSEGPLGLTISHDWANSNGDAFGALLAAISLRAAGRIMSDGEPSQLVYRYLKPVPTGSFVEVSVTEDRRSGSSADVTVQLFLDGELAGDGNVSVVARPKAPVTGPPMADVRPRSAGIPIHRLATAAGRPAGRSAVSWNPVERWDVPDLIDGSEPVFRAWTPNVTTGTQDGYLTAASLFMPIDALIWPATLQAMGYLPNEAPLATPTIEIAARFASVVDEPWYVAEASIDHFAGRTVAGTVRVWGASGAYGAVGHSLNLVVPLTNAVPSP